MVRRISLLLVLVLTVGAARLMTCELACAEQAATHEDAACHEGSDATTVLVSGTAHHCDYDAIAPSLTAQQKTIVSQHALVAVADVRPRSVWVLTTRGELLMLPPGTTSVSSSPRSSVLRI